MEREGDKKILDPPPRRETGGQTLARRDADEARARAPAEDEAAPPTEDEVRDDGEKLRSLGQLAAGAAHDINNALTAILGRTQLLLRRSRDEAERRHLRVIETAALDAAATARRVQNFARRAASAPAAPVSVSRLVRDALQLTRTRWETDARARGQAYRVSFAPAFEGADEVAAEASEVREVLVNLILNALDAMPRGGLLEVEETKEEGAVVVRVKDTGEGVAPELRERVFEPFFTTKGREGSGLGLSVSRRLVQRAGGTLEVEGRPGGGGSVFTLRFPAARSAGRAAPPPLARRFPPRRFLVVDDDAAVREVLAEMLRELGQHVSEADGATEALARLAQGPFDVLVTDLSMPGTDGLALAARARSLAPDLRVILLTGYGEHTPGGAPDPALVDLVVSKPFRLSDLEAALLALRTGEQSDT